MQCKKNGKEKESKFTKIVKLSFINLTALRLLLSSFEK